MRHRDYKVGPRIKQPAPPPAGRPAQPIERAIGVVAYLLAAMPLLLFASLYACSWRAAAVIGHWPQPLIDAPAGIELRDRWFEALAFAAGALAGLILIAPLVLAAGALALPAPAAQIDRLGRRYWALAVVHGVSLAILLIDPGGRLRWLLG